MARDVCAASVRRATGPNASRPPTSQTMRIGLGDADERAEDPVGGSEHAGAEAARDPPADRRPDRLAERDRDEQAGEHQERAKRGVDLGQLLGDERESEDDDRRPADRADEPTDLRERAGAEAEERAEGDQQERDDVQRVHGPIVAQAPKS